MEKFELLLAVLRSLQAHAALKHFVLIGSWCLDVYRQVYTDNALIPATRTLDADLLIPRRLPASVKVDIHQLMESHGFLAQTDYPQGFQRFVHPDLNFEFLTDAGAKSGASVHRFKQLGITALELRYMNIPLRYQMTTRIKDIELTLPEPEAFALHKLIVTQLRENAEKAAKDLEAAIGLFLFFENKPTHLERVRQIYAEFPKGWQKKVDAGLELAASRVSVKLQPS